MDRRSLLLGSCAIAVSQIGAYPAVAAPVNAVALGILEPIQQPSANSCWATAATILYSWKNNIGMEIDKVVAKGGQKYADIYSADSGLSGTDKQAFLSAMGLKAEAPQSYTPGGWEKLIKKYGPLWVTTAEPAGGNFSIHGRVLIAIVGDGSPDGTKVKLLDPADGKLVQETLRQMDTKFEQVAKIDLGSTGELRPQVVHY